MFISFEPKLAEAEIEQGGLDVENGEGRPRVSTAVKDMAKQTEAERELNFPDGSLASEFKPKNNNGKEETKVTEEATGAKTENKPKRSRTSRVKTIAPVNGGNGKAKNNKPLTSYDEAAKVFAAELAKLDKAVIMPIAKLVLAHFQATGHKRIGRALLAYARKNGGKSSKR